MNTVRNILAIAGKEMRSYFASPIAYIIIGLFALLFGWFFYVYLRVFVEQSQRMAMMGGGTVNVNEQMIRAVLQNAAVIILFVMPMITMRTYSEEKRSGTIELLLTSPLTDFEIIIGKFLGAMGCSRDAPGHDDRRRDPVPARQPRVAADCRRLPRPAADGRLLHLDRLLISSLTKNQIVAGFMTFAVFLMLWMINWLGRLAGRPVRSILSLPVDHRHFDDFTKGMHRHTQAIAYCRELHCAWPVPATAKSVDSERWRG